MNELNKKTIKLFKSVYNSDASSYSERALSYGILMPDVEDELVDYAIDLYGKDAEKFNSTFHKSFETVKNTSEDVLFLQQILHYVTTYGTNFTSEYVYIPTEELNVPNLDVDKIKLINIRNISEDELKNKVLTLCSVALSQETVNDVCDIIKGAFEYNSIIDNIRNKEVKCILCDTLKVVPSDPNEMLRFMIYLATGKTLKINNNQAILEIYGGMAMTPRRNNVNRALNTYISEYGIEPLAGIFLTNKELFLAFKRCDNKSIFNKMNKLAKKPEIRVIHANNEPKDNIFNTYKSLDPSVFEEFTTQKLFALRNRMLYMVERPEYIEYKIRNGKTFIKDFKSLDDTDIKLLNNRINWIDVELRNRLRDNFNNKVFYIPNGVKYALPITEKDFIGNIPNKSVVEIDAGSEEFVIGVEWETNCDLDLSYNKEDGSRVGWDSSYRDGASSVAFSGDMTSLVNGKACEAFLFNNCKISGNLNLAVYSNRSHTSKIPFKLIIAKNTSKTLNSFKSNAGCTDEEKYIFNPNNIIEVVNMEIENHQLNLCNVIVDGSKIKLVFDKTLGSNSLVYSRNEWDEKRIKINKINSKTTIPLNDLITTLGGHVTSDLKLAELYGDYVDLSFENLSKETLLKLTVDKQ